MISLKKLLQYPLLLVFGLFILGFSLADTITPPKDYSELENRYLQQRPQLTLRSVMDSSKTGFAQTYETFINDQFVLRDQWIDLKSKSETALLKIENNNIAYGKDGYLFEKYTTLNEERLDRNAGYVQSFAQQLDVPLTVGIVPNSYEILEDKWPLGFHNLDQESYIQEIYQQLSSTAANTLDLFTPLKEHQEEYIYYRTDHHWTTYGAYLGYSAYVRSLGMEPVDLNTLTGHEVSDFYGTYFSKCKKVGTPSDTITYYDIPITSMEYDGKTVDSLYQLDQFQKRDKYAAFLYGNNGVTTIRSENNQNHVDGQTSKVLVIKDSYSNSMVPFLTYQFDEVVVVDLRYLPTGLTQLIEEGDFDQVLLLYNFSSFESDTNLDRLLY